MEQVLGVGELRFELLAHFRPDGVAAGVDSRADGGLNISGLRAEPTPHFSHSFFDDALDRTAPARMENSHGSLFCVYQNDGQTIGGLDREQDAGQTRDEAIAD